MRENQATISTTRAKSKSEAPKTVLAHWFAPEEMNADIKHYVVYELQPLGPITQSSDFGKVM